MRDDTLLEYRIDRDHEKFVAIDSTEEVLGVFDTEQEATREVNERSVRMQCTSIRKFSSMPRLLP
jgi:hypothetical protein